MRSETSRNTAVGLEIMLLVFVRALGSAGDVLAHESFRRGGVGRGGGVLNWALSASEAPLVFANFFFIIFLVAVLY